MISPGLRESGPPQWEQLISFTMSLKPNHLDEEAFHHDLALSHSCRLATGVF
jgi:hypothetical protein